MQSQRHPKITTPLHRARTAAKRYEAQLVEKYEIDVGASHRLMGWMVSHCSWILRFQIKSDDQQHEICVTRTTTRSTCSLVKFACSEETTLQTRQSWNSEGTKECLCMISRRQCELLLFSQRQIELKAYSIHVRVRVRMSFLYN